MVRPTSDGRRVAQGRRKRTDPPPGPPPIAATAPVITAISAAPSASGASVLFTVDQPSYCYVEYGTTTGYGSSTTQEATATGGTHTVTVSGLTASTLYHARVHALNPSGLSTISSDFTFTTAAAGAVVIRGFGSQVTGGAGKTDYPITNLSGTSTAAGTLRAALSASNRNIFPGPGVPSGSVIPLGQSTLYMQQLSNITLDMHGLIDITGAPIFNRPVPIPNTSPTQYYSGTHCANLIFRNTRHRGGYTYSNPDEAQQGDGFTNVTTQGVVYDHVSAWKYTDEGISFTSGVQDATVQDCLIAGHGDGGCHNYGGLASGNRITYLRTGFIRTSYRNPQFEGSASALFEFINCVHVGVNALDCPKFDNGNEYAWGTGALGSPRINIINNWYQDDDRVLYDDNYSTNPTLTVNVYHSGNTLRRCVGTLGTSHAANTIPAANQVPGIEILTADQARQWIKQGNAGCQPLDSVDIAILAYLDAS